LAAIDFTDLRSNVSALWVILLVADGISHGSATSQLLRLRHLWNLCNLWFNSFSVFRLIVDLLALDALLRVDFLERLRLTAW